MPLSFKRYSPVLKCLFFVSDAGTETCSGFPGSLGHEAVDAATFSSWGIDCEPLITTITPLARTEPCDSDLKYGEYRIFRSGTAVVFLNRNMKITAMSRQIGPIVV